MRYRDTGEVHKNFHAATNATIDYVVNNFGESALTEILQSMGTEVYKSIHTKLKNGDASELIEHIKYYMDREQGKYQINVTETSIVLEVAKCPAVQHIIKSGLPLSPYFCQQTIAVNDALCAGTDWTTKTEVFEPGKCKQTFTLEGSS